MTVYLYIFGKIGGPFKVGYSKNPEKRAKSIMFFAPGNAHCAKAAMMWDMFPLPDQATAKVAERFAHWALKRYQIPLYRGFDNHPIQGSEWFNARLSVVRKVVARVVAHHNHTALRVVVSARHVEMLDRWRSKQADTPTRSVAIERIMTAAMDREEPDRP